MNRHRLLPIVAILLAIPASASHPNLLTNGAFDTSTAGWGEAPWVTWATTDIDGSPHSGSAKLVIWANGPIEPAGGSLEVTASPCIPLQPGEHFAVTGSVWVDEAGAEDQVGIGFALFQDSGCDPFAAGWSPYLWWAESSTNTGWQTGGRSVDGDVWAPRGVKVLLMLGDNPPGNQITAYFDGLELRQGACEPGPPGQNSSGLRHLCLNDGRFQVSAAWRAPNGDVGFGEAVPFSADSGSFWFFNPDNLELDVKVLDGCSLNQRYWLFAAGLTNVEVTLTVLDTETGQQNSYFNPLDQTFVTITDTDAFDTCP